MSMPPEDTDLRLRALAQRAAYPPTPDLWPAVSRSLEGTRADAGWRRRWVPALAGATLALILGVAAIPEARAAVIQVLRLGAARILVDPGAPATAAPGATITPRAIVLPPGLSDLAGETTLEAANDALGGTLELPSYPTDLGEPDRVYLQDRDGLLILLVWLDPADAARVRMTLHLVGPGGLVGKSPPAVVEHTRVDGEPALWVVGPHFLLLRSGAYELRSLVEGNVLIWERGALTYRLETLLPLDEARRVAESLR